MFGQSSPTFTGVVAETAVIEEPPAASSTSSAPEEPAPAEGTSQADVTGAALPRESPPMPEFDKWRRWWTIPMWIGVGITVLGGLLLFWVQQKAGVNFWFFCASVPLLIGLLVIVLAWQSRTARWLHLRVEENKGGRRQKIALSFPLPLRLTAWFVRIFGDRIPNLKGTSVDEVILALGSSTTPDNPLYVEVEDDEDGDKVQIFIG